MLKPNFMTITSSLLALGLLCGCSNKVLPQGTRVSVLDQEASVKAEVADGASQIQLPTPTAIAGWRQTDVNAQHVIPNAQMGAKFARAWKADFGKGSSKHEFLISQPLINGNVAYTLDAEGLMRAFNLNDGETLWGTELEAKQKYVDDTAIKGVGMAMEGGVIYATTGFGVIYAVNAEDGKILWQKDMHTLLRIAPVIAAGKLLIQSVDNKFYALNIKNGEKLWEYDIAMENTTMVGGSTPAYSPSLDVVVTGFSNGELQAFNGTIGTPLWSDTLISQRQAYSSTYLHTIKAAPVVEGGKVYALGRSNVMAAIDMRTGTRIWEKAIGGINTPLLAGNTLYVVTGKQELVALNKENGRILWAKNIDFGEKEESDRIFAPVMIDSRLVVALSNGDVLFYNPKTGDLTDRLDTDEELNAAPVAANGYVLFVTANAKLLAYK
ncbi:MAG: PQQ-binding-like beta-propeller repeat protein [Alphaproteobacteria bacterium]|nr:PQQ-binding-like beta-propeller repeat protein [Alphaproteobacteria bacterium]